MCVWGGGGGLARRLLVVSGYTDSFSLFRRICALFVPCKGVCVIFSFMYVVRISQAMFNNGFFDFCMAMGGISLCHPLYRHI